ncbi:MAG: zinc ribbon domain-containing protein [Polyangiaceae bacterium]
MTLIAFTKNHQDLSTDRGYQFNFYCDKCGNGYMTSFQASVIGTAGSVLRAAGSIFGGVVSSAGNGAYEMQRAVGGPAHDSAFKAAVDECKGHFCQCRNCGSWVCPEVCFNAQAGQCKTCAPDFDTQFASNHAHAKVDAARGQLSEAAQKVDYVHGADLGANAVWHAPAPQYGAAAYAPLQPGMPGYGAPPAPPAPMNAPPSPQQNDPYRAPQAAYGAAPPPGGYGAAPATPVTPASTATALPCAVCKRTTGGVKFCEDCGTPRSVTCPNCNQPLHAGAKFCGTCGSHL